jgi:NADH-quinone oxidoreductase subunit J
MILPQLVFWVMAVIAVLGGIGVIGSRQPIRSVLSLVAVMLALSVIFLELSAQFVFAVQVIVYAGAVMVLFLFVVALLGPMRERASGPLRFQWWLGTLVALVFGGFIYGLLNRIRFRMPDKVDTSVFGTVQQIGAGLFTTYLYPFELTSLLLLVAAVGAIYLSRGGRTASEIHRDEEDRRA